MSGTPVMPIPVDFKGQLQELFYHTHSIQQINEIIAMVQESESTLSPDEQLEEMVNLLIESGDSTLYAGGSEEGAVGFSSDSKTKHSFNQFSQHFDHLLNMFPGICPNFLIEFCQKYDHFDFSQIAADLSQMEYVKLEVDPMDIWEHLKEMLPDADPTYLRNQARVLVTRPASDLQEFVHNAIEKKDYPTMQEYLTKKQECDQLNVYRKCFAVEEFLEKVPDPLEMFLKPDFKSALTGSDNNDESDKEFAQIFLYNQFNHIRKREIDKVFAHYGRHLIKTYNRLKTWPRSFRRSREVILVEEDECKNEALLKEVTFLQNEKTIRQFLKMRDELYNAQYEEAKLYGLLETCACCFDEEIIPEQCYFCNNNCVFCKNCVRMGAEHAIGKGDTVFPCLANCSSEFHLSTIKMVLDKNVFERLCQRIQMEEVKKANVEGLETCPFCDFSMIPVEGDKIFKCKNIECMKESCRECRHISHIPLKCSEIEYDEDIKIRTFIENKMSEALLRRCHSCSKVFYKESGCNKMTCTCGARMCYVCGKAVVDYSHFGDRGRCPLFTENLKQFHLNRVLEGAQSAKAELGINDNPNKLKFDPTQNLEQQDANKNDKSRYGFKWVMNTDQNEDDEDEDETSHAVSGVITSILDHVDHPAAPSDGAGTSQAGSAPLRSSHSVTIELDGRTLSRNALQDRIQELYRRSRQFVESQSDVSIEAHMRALDTSTYGEASTAVPPSYSTVIKQGRPYLDLRRDARSVEGHHISPFSTRVPPPAYAEIEAVWSREISASSSEHVLLGPDPIYIWCARCNAVVVTQTHSHRSKFTHFTAFALCLCGCWPCCLLPYCLSSCKNTYHYCPQCENLFGMYSPW